MSQERRITIDGIEYYLVPVEQDSVGNVINDYVSESKEKPDVSISKQDEAEKPEISTTKEPPASAFVSTGPSSSMSTHKQSGLIKKAIGKISEYRERFKNKKVSPLEFRAEQKLPPLVQFGESDFRQVEEAVGDKIFDGEGTQYDL